MVGKLQPLASNYQIVNPDGTPTLYFIRFMQEKQIDITAGITAEQAQALIDDWAAHRRIDTDVPITGGGDLSADLTIGHADSGVVAGTYGDGTNVAQITVDDKGHVTDVQNVPITGGGGGGGGFGAVPTLADFPLTIGSSALITATAAAINIGGAANGTGIQGVGAAVASPFALSAEVPGFAGDAFNSSGIWVSDGVKFLALNLLAISSTQQVLEFARWSNSGAFISSATLNFSASDRPLYRLEVNGGSVTPYISYDGVYWWQMFPADTTWLVANECGAHTNRNNASISPVCAFKGFTIT